MIYTYDDIVKTTKEEYRFMYLSRNDIGKCITVYDEDAGTVFGGVIRQFYKGHIIFEDTTITNDYCETAAKCLTPEEILEHPRSKVCVYNPSSGMNKIYTAEELVLHILPNATFNTDILKPESRFFLTENNKCGIVEVTGFTSSDTNVKLVDANSLLKHKETIINVNNEFIKRATWKPIEEVTACDLFGIGFNNHVMTFDTAVLELLEHIEVMPHEDKT